MLARICCSLLSLVPIASAQALVLENVRYLASDGHSFIEGYSILVVDGRIQSVARAPDLPAGTKRIDLTGTWLIPGLIDLHSHLLLHPYDEATWNDQVLKESIGLRTIRGTVAARKTLDAGFTTLRELGTEGAGYADVALRDAIAAGLIPGPRVFASTRALVATGCYGPSGFAPHVRVPKGAQEADGVDGVRKAVREQIANGADWVKVYADYRRRRGDRSTPTFSRAELEAICDEAAAAGLRVAAHASTDEAIRRAVLSGVTTIEHGYEASSETLQLMRERGVALCPTLTASESIARYAGWNGGKPEPAPVRQARAMFGRALASGVTIACGSDVGVFAHGDNARELELMVAYGMSPKDAILAATSVAAEVLGKGKELGQIRKGFVADLVALRSNPFEAISAVRQPVFVMKAGVVHRAR